MFEDLKDITGEDAQKAAQALSGRTFMMRVAESDGVMFIRIYDGQLRWLTDHTMACISNTAATPGEPCDCEPLPAFTLGPTLLDHNMPVNQVVGYFNMAIKALRTKDKIQTKINKLFRRG